MSEFTKGPWVVSSPDTGEITIVSPWSDTNKAGEAEVFGDYRGAHIATIRFVSDTAVPTERQALANSHLIAASPDMYDALEIINAFLGDLDERDEVYPAIVKVREALKKARGDIRVSAG